MTLKYDFVIVGFSKCSTTNTRYILDNSKVFCSREIYLFTKPLPYLLDELKETKNTFWKDLQKKSIIKINNFWVNLHHGI